MAHTNSTANFGLPQWIGDDKPTFLGDLNTAFNDIDTAMQANKVSAQEANNGVNTNAGAITALQGDVGGLDTRLTTVEGVAGQNTGNINTINSLIGNGTPTTTDQTLIGAINELNGDKVTKGNILRYIGTKSFEVAYDGTKTYSAILDELYAQIKTYIEAKSASTYKYRIISCNPNSAVYSNGYYGDPSFHTNAVPSALILMANNLTSLVNFACRASSSVLHLFDLTTGTYADLSAVVPSSGGRCRVSIEEYSVV